MILYTNPTTRQIFVEAIPGTWSLVASRAAWEGLSPAAQIAVIKAVYDRLGVVMPGMRQPEPQP